METPEDEEVTMLLDEMMKEKNRGFKIADFFAKVSSGKNQ